jgi:hypothetical protein
MTGKTLKLFAATVVVESKLSKVAKKQMLSFIKNEATVPQIKALLMDGKIVQLDAQAEEIVHERFKKFHLTEDAIVEGTFKTILGMILLTPIGWAYWRGIKAAFSEKQRRCGMLGIGAKRDACLLAATAEMSKRTIELLKKESKNCAHSKSPDKCKAAIEKQIAKHTAKMQKANDKLSKMTQKGKGHIASAGKEKAADPKAKVV